jgi:putative ABC transport system substrate-binding protein
MRRREFIALLGGAAGVWPLAARAQQAMPVIGFLNSASAEQYADRVRAFHAGLGEAGYVEGRNVAIEYRWAHGSYDRLSDLAADLVQRQVQVIVANSPATAAARVLTTTIPIVFDSGSDPVVAGWVASLSRPGGNLTGVSNLNVELAPKRLELLHELVPKGVMIAALINPTNPNSGAAVADLQAAARALERPFEIVNAARDSVFENAFLELERKRAGALVIGSDPLFNGTIERLAALAAQHRLPAIYQSRDFAAAGGLLSYGGSRISDAYRIVGHYAGRILKGEKPADMPVQQSTKIELIINLKVGKALGVTIPLALLGRADEVIE